MKIYAYVTPDGVVTATKSHTTPPEGLGESCFEVADHFVWTNPTPTSIPKWVDGAIQWVETASLEDLKARKNDEINAARAQANETTFVFQGKHIRCDTVSKFDILSTNGCVALTGQFQPDWSGGWKTEDNAYVAITDIPTWTAFYMAMMNQGQGNFSHAQSLKQRLASATTPEEVAAIHW